MPIDRFLVRPGQGSPATPGQDPGPLRELAQPFLPMERIRELYRRAQQPAARSLLENVLTVGLDPPALSFPGGLDSSR
jgi:hypothetical protein